MEHDEDCVRGTREEQKRESSAVRLDIDSLDAVTGGMKGNEFSFGGMQSERQFGNPTSGSVLFGYM